MNVTLIGTGNVATVLGRLLNQKGHNIAEVAGKNSLHANRLANELGAKAGREIKNISGNADIYIIAVSDDAINAVASELKLHAGILVHTSGAVSKDVLKGSAKEYGVLYPLQSLRKEVKHIPEIPSLIDANTVASKETLLLFAKSFSSFVEEADDEKRLKMHVAAVAVSNFTNHLFALAADYCSGEQLNFSSLIPLIKEVSSRISLYPPSNMQTGPAVRSDTSTIEKHLSLLDDYPDLKKVYRLMSESILKFHDRL